MLPVLSSTEGCNPVYYLRKKVATVYQLFSKISAYLLFIVVTRCSSINLRQRVNNFLHCFGNTVYSGGVHLIILKDSHSL